MLNLWASMQSVMVTSGNFEQMFRSYPPDWRLLDREIIAQNRVSDNHKEENFREILRKMEDIHSLGYLCRGSRYELPESQHINHLIAKRRLAAGTAASGGKGF